MSGLDCIALAVAHLEERQKDSNPAILSRNSSDASSSQNHQIYRSFLNRFWRAKNAQLLSSAPIAAYHQRATDSLTAKVKSQATKLALWALLISSMISTYQYLGETMVYVLSAKKSDLISEAPDRWNADTYVNRTNLWLVRPFVDGDVQKLVASFDQWSALVPCSKSRNVDLVLVYGRRLYKNSNVVKILSPLISDFNEKKTNWHHCFRSMQLAPANLAACEDTYMKRGSHPRRFQGPNSQFNAILGMAFNGLSGRRPNCIFLMEADTLPQRAFWLDDILEEIHREAPFMVLGGAFFGVDWDKERKHFKSRERYIFASHINGNAVYNLTDPMWEGIYDQLTEDLDKEHASPYDVRINELDFDAVGHGSRYKTSKVIGNWGKRVYMDKIREKFAVIHGEVRVSPWPKHETVDLVISNFHGASGIERLLDSLSNTRHPFGNVYVFDEEGMDFETLLPSGVKVHILHRSSLSSGFDWIDAPVESKWMMYSTSFFRLVSTDLVGVYDESGEFTPFIQYCEGDALLPDMPVEELPLPPSWLITKKTRRKKHNKITSLRRANGKMVHDAKVFHKIYDKHISMLFSVFKTDTRQRFFKDWLAATVNGTEGRYPTSDDYFAWCASNDAVKYTFNPQHTQGSFIILEPIEHHLYNMTNMLPLQTVELFQAQNEAYKCFNTLQKDDCLSMDCDWDEHFERCDVFIRAFKG